MNMFLLQYLKSVIYVSDEAYKLIDEMNKLRDSLIKIYEELDDIQALHDSIDLAYRGDSYMQATKSLECLRLLNDKQEEFKAIMSKHDELEETVTAAQEWLTRMLMFIVTNK